MLGLSTHEPNFYIIREVWCPPNQKQCSLCGRNGHFFMDCALKSQLDPDQRNLQKEKSAEE
jgi:5'-3' exoribonuclease 2